MATLLALDVAILLPQAVASCAVSLSSALPAEASQGLRLGPDVLPHITLTQQFVRLDEIDAVFARLDAVLQRRPRLQLRVTGGARGSNSVWMAIDASDALSALHEDLMTVLASLEVPNGDSNAFVGGDARPGDVHWVAEYRRKASFTAFTPHITLGHATVPPVVEAVTFEAITVAACHLGKFCTCQRVLRRWALER